MGELQPRMRAGDKDRQQVVEQLGKHFAEGRLTVAEFDERAGLAHASTYLDELPALTVDLPHASTPRPRPARHQQWARATALVALLTMLLFWAVVVAVLDGAPVILMALLLFLFLRHRRWSRRW